MSIPLSHRAIYCVFSIFFFRIIIFTSYTNSNRLVERFRRAGRERSGINLVTVHVLVVRFGYNQTLNQITVLHERIYRILSECTTDEIFSLRCASL